MHRHLAAIAAAFVLMISACGGDDDGATPGSATTPAGPTLSPLEQKLASVVLQASDVPDGMEASAPDFATNEELAGLAEDELQRLIDLGRQLGVDVQFIPTDRLDQGEPLRGLQSSASVYTAESGAGQSFREVAEEARAVDWAQGYPELEDLQVTEMQESISDESFWLRITGQLGCTFIVNPTPDAQGIVPTPACEDTKLFIVDEIIFRTGRTRSYLKVTTLFDPDAPAESSYVTQIKTWAERITQRAGTTFPS